MAQGHEEETLSQDKLQVHSLLSLLLLFELQVEASVILMSLNILYVVVISILFGMPVKQTDK